MNNNSAQKHEDALLELKRATLTVAVSTAFINPFLGSAINVALPVIGNQFSADAVLLSWVAISYLLTSTVFMIPFGRLADICGKKKIYLTGIVIFTISNILCAFSNSINSLIAYRVIQGISSSMIFSTSMAILISVYPPPERGKALGMTVASTYTGLSIGPFLGGMLTQYIGWRSIFWFAFIISSYAVILTIYKLKNLKSDASFERFDYAGAALYMIASTLFMYGFTKLPEMIGLLMLTLGVFIGLLFIYVEKKVQSPVLDIKLFFNNRRFAFSNLAALINYSATFGLGFLLSFYLQYNRGMSPKDAGTTLIAQPIIMALFSPLIGRLSDKVEPAVLSSIGMGITSIGLFLFSLLGPDTSISLIVLNLVMMGFGFALFSSPNINAVMSSVEKKTYGIASGILSTMRTTGQMLSMGISSMMISIYIGKQKIGPDNQSDFLACVDMAFMIFAILCTIGIFCSLSRGKMHEGVK